MMKNRMREKKRSLHIKIEWSNKWNNTTMKRMKEKAYRTVMPIHIQGKMKTQAVLRKDFTK